MLTISNTLILKRKLHLSSGEQTTKTYHLLSLRYSSQSYQIYDIYDPQTLSNLTLKLMIKNQHLSKQKSINEIKNQQLFSGVNHFINLIDIYEDSHCIYLVMEKWGKTLAEIMDERVTLTQCQVQVIFSQIVQAIVELRKKNIAHNAIMLDSIYVDVTEKHRIKLGNFSKSFNLASYFQNISSQKLQSGQLKPLTLKPSLSQFSNLTKTPQATNPYTSPQQLNSSLQQDYSSYLQTLYQNDIWSLGIILFRLLLGRYPFQDQQNSSEQSQHQWTFQVFANKSENDSVKKKQCCFRFWNQDRIYQQPVSIYFKELIKAILKPVDKRIRLKDLINHPLKLLDLNNVNDIDLQSPLTPFMKCNAVVVDSLRPIKEQLRDNYIIQKRIQEVQEQQKRWNSNSKLMQSKTDNFFKNYEQRSKSKFNEKEQRQNKKVDFIEQNSQQSEQKLNELKFFSPESNYSVFSIYNSEPAEIFSGTKSKHKNQLKSSKYAYTWDLNFIEMQEIGSQISINEPVLSSQTDNLFPKTDRKKKSSCEIDLGSRKIVNDKTLRHINALDNYEVESQPYEDKEDNDSKQNDMKKSLNKPKRVPSANSLQRQPFRSMHNSGVSSNQQGFISTNKASAATSNQFNIRTLSKKNITLAMTSQQGKKLSKPQQSSQMFQSEQFPMNQKYKISSSSSSQLSSILNNNRFTNTNSKVGSVYINPNQQSEQTNKYQINQNDQIFESQINTDCIPVLISSTDKQFEGTKGKGTDGSKDDQGSLTNFQNNEIQLLILKNQLSPIPLLVTQPEFVLQYKYKKQDNALGYVLNNGVGVIFSNGKHILGHNQNDFIVIKSTKALTSQTKYPFQHTRPTVQSRSLTSFRTLTQSEIQLYHFYLKLFGKRIIISNFALWIKRFWIEGRVVVFLFNNGSWQVTFEGKKTSKFFIIDENQLVWNKGKVKPEILNHVRKIVKDKKKEIILQEMLVA